MTDSHKEVRALSRGLTILIALNRRGNSTAVEISEETKLNRTTVYRLLDTLISLGFVSRNMSDERFELMPAVRRLSEGFTDTDFLARIVAPELGRLFSKVLWPTDFAIFEKGAMQIRESTQRFSPYSVDRGVIGTTRMFTRSALGRAVLTAASPEQRVEMLRQTIKEKQPDMANASSATYVNAIIQETKSRGYASSVGETDNRISAIALPVNNRGKVVGAINLIFFRSTMQCEDAAKKFLGEMQHSVRAIEARIGTMNLTPSSR